METMQAVVYKKYGPPYMLQLKEVAKPVPAWLCLLFGCKNGVPVFNAPRLLRIIRSQYHISPTTPANSLAKTSLS
jgi:hypothetical protein